MRVQRLNPHVHEVREKVFDGQLVYQRARRVKDVRGAGAQICYYKKPMGVIPAEKAGELGIRCGPAQDP
jgi:hypothetical protein